MREMLGAAPGKFPARRQAAGTVISVAVVAATLRSNAHSGVHSTPAPVGPARAAGRGQRREHNARA